MVEDATDALCWEIVKTIADERGVEASSIEQRVGDVVNVDALG